MKRKIYAALTGLVILTGIVFFMTSFRDFVVFMGAQIPQTDLAGDYLIGLTWAIFLGMSIFFWPIPSRHRPMLLSAWFAKCVVGLGFMLIYEYNYGIDAYWYFDLSRQLDFVPGVSIGDGAKAVVSLCWAHNQFFPASYHMMKMSFAMIGLISIYLFYLAFCEFRERERPELFYSLALFPSIIFWSTILGKDPLILLGVAIYTYGVARWNRTGKFKFLFIIGLGVAETLTVRVWMAAILLAPLGVFAMKRVGGLLGKAIFIGTLSAALYFSLDSFKEKFGIESQGDVVSQTQSLSHSWARGGSGEMAASFGGTGEMVRFLPIGIFTALFRPLPGEVRNAFGTLAGLENAVMLIFLFQSILRTRLVELGEPWVAWGVILVLVWASIYGFASFQNLGAAVRFRLQIQPILLCMLLYLRRIRSEDLLEDATST